MSSADWERVEPAIREKCFFSARVENAEILGKMRNFIGQAVDAAKRDPNQALLSKEKFISEMKGFLRSKGYAVDGTALTDIASRRRLSLIYKMNYDEAREYAKYTRGQDSDALYMFPAQEFLRVEPRRVPRADWAQRWRAAGGRIYGGGMVALKSSEVWQNLSRFGRPYPPFDFGSGMGVEDVGRDDAIALGLLPKDEPADEIPDFDAAFETEVSLDRIPPELREAIKKETPNAEIKGDKLVMRSAPKLPTWQDKGLESAKTWKPTLKEKTVDLDYAKKRLSEGVEVSNPLGEKVTFSDENIHWLKQINEKNQNDLIGRLVRLPIAEDCVAMAMEIWELPNGYRNYIAVYEKTTGFKKGIAVSVKGNDVNTYFVEDVLELNKFRKGRLVYAGNK